MEERDLVRRSHIIPRFITELGRKDRSEAFSLLSTNSDWKGKSLIGFYDEYILSKEAEEKFSKWESYANKLFSSQAERIAVSNESDSMDCLIYNNFDYEKISLFFLSILWRASISTRKEFLNVDLGEKYNELARQMLVNEKFECEKGFGFILNKLSSVQREELTSAVLTPSKRYKFYGVNGYHIFMLGFRIFFKVDQKNFNRALDTILITKDRPLIIIESDFEESKELQLFIGMAKNL